jgi:hypothetical protein
MLTQPGRTLCGRAKISSLRVPGDSRSSSGYISSGFLLVSRTSAITTSQSTCLRPAHTNKQSPSVNSGRWLGAKLLHHAVERIIAGVANQ